MQVEKIEDKAEIEIDMDLIKSIYNEEIDKAIMETKGKMLDDMNKTIWFQTFSGKQFHPYDCKEDQIDINDIAHALSKQCRFNGHINKFYSVAQHCIIVSYLCDKQDALYGLLHDASEAYLSDIPSPLKHSEQFSFYRNIEKNVQDVIYNKFNLSVNEPLSVKSADKLALHLEAECLSDGKRKWVNNNIPLFIKPLKPSIAKKVFLNRFKELYGK